MKALPILFLVCLTITPPAIKAETGNYFIDADELKPDSSMVRPWIDKALREQDPELVASIPVMEMIAASPKDVADLVMIARKKGFGKRQAQWLAVLGNNKNIKFPEALELLAKKQQLSGIIERLPSPENKSVLNSIGARSKSPEVFAASMIPLITKDTRDSKLLAFQLMARARKLGIASEVRRELAHVQSFNGNILRFIEASFPPRLPILIAHRGGHSKKHPENTIELIRETLTEGIADGIEIDISMTKDNVPILWHDEDPTALISQVRGMGLEPAPFRPDLAEPCTDPTHEMSFGKIRKLFRYVSNITGRKAKSQVPTLEDSFKEIQKTRPDLKVIVLDIKASAKQKDKLISLADQIVALAKKYKFEGRIVCMHTEEEGAKILKERSQGVYEVTHDIELAQPISNAKDYTGVAMKAHREGRTYTSMGRPVISQEGWGGYLAAVRANMNYIDETGTNQKFVAWTINDEVEFRELIGTGVQYVLTDNLPGLSKVLQEYKQ